MTESDEGVIVSTIESPIEEVPNEPISLEPTEPKKEAAKEDTPKDKKKKASKPKQEAVKVSNPPLSVSPVKEGDGRVSTPQVFLVVDNNAVLVASQATIEGSDLTVSIGVCDGVYGRRLLKPLAKGRAVEPTYKDATIEVYVLGGVNKRLTNISIKEFETSDLTDGRMALLKLACKFKGIEDSEHCPYPMMESLKPKAKGQTKNQTYKVRDTRVPIGDIPAKTATQLY